MLAKQLGDVVQELSVELDSVVFPLWQEAHRLSPPDERESKRRPTAFKIGARQQRAKESKDHPTCAQVNSIRASKKPNPQPAHQRRHQHNDDKIAHTAQHH